jgi:hypothetical protein
MKKKKWPLAHFLFFTSGGGFEPGFVNARSRSDNGALFISLIPSQV